VREKFEDNDDLIIGLAVAIAYDQHTPARERYLAQLCTPFAERIVKYMGMWDQDQVKSSMTFFGNFFRVRHLQII
jgi:hypothetical protein